MIWGIEDGIKFKTLHEIVQNWKKPKPQSGYWKRPLVLLKIFVSWSWIDWSTIWNVVEQNSNSFAKKVITSIVEQTNRTKYFTELCKRCAPRYFRTKWLHAFVNYANYSVCAIAWHLFHTSSIYTSFFDGYCICMQQDTILRNVCRNQLHFKSAIIFDTAILKWKYQIQYTLEVQCSVFKWYCKIRSHCY